MSSIVDPVGTFKFIAENRLTRYLLSALVESCRADNDTRLNIGLEIFAGIRDPSKTCWKCRLTSKFISYIIKAGARSFGAAIDDIEGAMRDVYWRRGLASVIKGIAFFGVRKPFVPGAPFLIVWDITSACNLKCKHCYSSAGAPLSNELTTEEAKKVIRGLAKAGVVALAWSGGEPMVRRDIYELSKYAYEHGMYVAMATNGTLINEVTASMLWNSGVRFLQISLDYVNPEEHDEFRGVKGAWERTIEGIKVAIKKGFFVNVAMTLVKSNVKDVPKMIDLCEKLGVRWLMIYNFIPAGRGVHIADEDPSPEEREEVLRLLWRESKRRKIGLLTTAPYFSRCALMEEAGYTTISDTIVFPTHFQNVKLGGRLKALSEFIGGCGAGRSYIGIYSDGGIRPCVFFYPLKIGNILDVIDRFEEWWRNDSVLNDLRDKDSLKGVCGECSFRYVCGGCRARAYGYLGDYMESDPGCILCKDLYEKLLKQKAEVASNVNKPPSTYA